MSHSDSFAPFVRRVELLAGSLTLHVQRADVDLDQLCGFATRHNPARGFLFVSKVLGKHIPARPADMIAATARLAAKLIHRSGPTLFIGLAETATGLAQGVFEHFLASNAADALFISTTRHRFRRDLAVEFLEPHSHAPQQLLYWPDDAEHCSILRRARNLIVVDDEISTGVTLGNMVHALQPCAPQLEHLQVISLKNWMSAVAEAALVRRARLKTQFHSLIRGTFEFSPNPTFHPPPLAPPPEESEYLDDVITHWDRFGTTQKVELANDAADLTRGLSPGCRLLVLGTGEFHYPPLLLARELEMRGFDVFYQSTTRSPILLGHDIRSVCSFVDHNYAGIQNHVYNVTDTSYDRILIGYDVAPLPPAHNLAALIGGAPLFFSHHGVRRGADCGA